MAKGVHQTQGHSVEAQEADGQFGGEKGRLSVLC